MPYWKEPARAPHDRRGTVRRLGAQQNTRKNVLTLNTYKVYSAFVEKKITFIDLFAGLGGIRIGFEQGLRQKGFVPQCLLASEIKDFAVAVYKKHFGESKIHGDITKIPATDIPDFDFLLAGFPCQPFSSAGKGLGFSDTRGTMFFEIERILKGKISSGKKPMGFLLENVDALVSHDRGNTFKVIVENLENLGYAVSCKILDSKDFGLAQSRKRIYIIGLQDKKINLDSFEKKTAVLDDILSYGKPTSKSHFTKKLLEHYNISELYGKSIKDKRGGAENIHSWDLELKGSVSQEQKNLLNQLLKERRKKKWAEEIGIKWMDGMPLTRKQIETFYQNQNLQEMLDDLTVKGYLVYEHPKKWENGVRVPDETKPKGYNIVAGKLSFEFSKILNPKKIAPTLVAMDATKLGVIDGDGVRKLTVKEVQKLFGYDDSYDLSVIKESDAYDLLGNTVCIPVIKAITEKIFS